MLFKNLLCFRVTAPFSLGLEAIEAALAPLAFRPVPPSHAESVGFVSPVDRRGDAVLTHAGSGAVMFCLKRQERELSSSAVKEAAEARIQEIAEQTGRKVGGKERKDIMEQVRLELLPKALLKAPRFTYACLDLQREWLLVDAGSWKRAETLCGLLRQSLGLEVAPFSLQQEPRGQMTAWLQSPTGAPSPFFIGDQCTLENRDGAVVNVRRMQVDNDEVQAHLRTGMWVSQLALNWVDGDAEVAFRLKHDTSLGGLKFGDFIEERRDGQDLDAAALFDADFILQQETLRRLVPALVEAMGGARESEAAPVPPAPAASGEVPW